MKQYWASKPTEEIAKEIKGKFDDYKKYVETSGMLSDLRKSYSTYYSRPYIQTIDQSLQAMHTNLYANSIKIVKTIVTANRPAWEPQAINTDLETQADTQLASGLLDYVMREKGVEGIINKAIEHCLFLREGWVSLGWDPMGGKVVAPDPEQPDRPIHEGDLTCKHHTILDVGRDVQRRDLNHQWYIIRESENRWDYAAKYPEHAEKIEQVEADNRFDIQYEFALANYGASAKDKDSDLISTLTLFHDKTPAMPQGRMVKICGDIVLFDGPLPYKRLYIFPMTSSEHFDNAFGYSQMMDLLPIQDACDTTVSSILSAVSSLGVGNVQGPKGATPKVTELENGMGYFEYDPKAGKLEPLNLLEISPELFKFKQELQNDFDTIGGTPPITKGVAPATMSGTAMALLQQQAIQFSSGTDQGRIILLEHVGTGVIELYQTFAVVSRKLPLIVGKSKRSMLKEFSKANLEGIGRVRINVANPLSQTASGKVSMAEALLGQPGMITTPEQYLGVLTTGNLEPLYQADNAQRMNMISENEVLMEGGQAIALLTDNHSMHILEHAAVLSSPESRQNPAVVQAVLAHITEHMNLAKGMDPALAATLKQPSLYQPPVMPPPGPPQPGAAAQATDSQNPITKQAEQTPLPQPAQPPQL